MLYNKKNTGELDTALFKNPTSEYRGAPFWGWNCELEEEELLRQIEIFKEMGFGGFHMHPRSGMKTEYLGEKYMELVKACVKKAKDEGMLAWLYDEDRWASGSAGGYVTSIKKYRERLVVLTVNKKADAEEKQKAIQNGKPYLLNIFDVVLNEDGTLRKYRVIGENEGAEGQKWYAYSANPGELGWYNGNTYVDTLNPEAIDKFLEVTHEAYFSAVGEEFGKTVLAIFTDEPHHSDIDQLRFCHDTNDVALSWTHDFDESFLQEYGFDIKEKLPELLWNLENNEVSYARYCYHNHVTVRFNKAFIAKMGKWCREHNIMLTGHMAEEDSLIMQSRLVGEEMRAYPEFDMPGVDMLCDTISPTTTKQAQSVVRQYGKEGMIVEHCGVTNWDFDFKGHKFHSDWLMALGATVRVHHGSWVSAKGMAKRDFPASIHYHAPWHTEYSYVENHCARVATALTRGKPLVKVAVIHPIESMWLYFGAQESNEDMQRALEENFQNVTRWLLCGMVDFDFVSEALLCELYRGSENGEFAVGEMQYSTVIVPECITLRRTTVEKLCEFRKKGGKLIFMGSCPQYVDAKKSDAVRELFDASECISFNRMALLDAVSAQRMLEVRDSAGKMTDNFVHALREDGQYTWLFLAHIKKDKDITGHIVDAVYSAAAQKIKIKIKGEWKPVLFDTVSGEISEIPYSAKNGSTCIERDVYAHDSLLLRLEKSDEGERTEEREKPKVIKSLDIKSKVLYKREEDNVYLLDVAEMSEDGKHYEPAEEMRRIDTALNVKYGFPTADLDDIQPWARKKSEEKTIWLKFRIFSDVDIRDCCLACEEIISAELSGAELPLSDCGWYFDTAIRKYRLPELKKGENILIAKVPFSNTTGLENMFILGDFDVKNEGTKNTILPKTEKIAFGSITHQGMPFYGGNITYITEVDTPEGGMLIEATNFHGTLVKVSVDGEEKGIIAYSPYAIQIKGLQAGKHTIEFKLFGNRYNTFGALHNCGDMRWAGPNMWFSKNADWCYEYNLKATGIMKSPVFKFFN